MKALFTAIFIFSVMDIQATPFIAIGETKFFLVSSKPESDDSKRTYLPLGETLESWTKMLTIQLHKKEKEAGNYLFNNNFQPCHPDSQDANLIRNEKTKTEILSYMTYPKKSSTPFDANWNLVRSAYKKDTGVFVYHYTARVYTFEKDIWKIATTDRTKLFGPFGEATFEELE